METIYDMGQKMIEQVTKEKIQAGLVVVWLKNFYDFKFVSMKWYHHYW